MESSNNMKPLQIRVVTDSRDFKIEGIVLPRMTAEGRIKKDYIELPIAEQLKQYLGVGNYDLFEETKDMQSNSLLAVCNVLGVVFIAYAQYLVVLEPNILARLFQNFPDKPQLGIVDVKPKYFKADGPIKLVHVQENFEEMKVFNVSLHVGNELRVFSCEDIFGSFLRAQNSNPMIDLKTLKPIAICPLTAPADMTGFIRQLSYSKDCSQVLITESNLRLSLFNLVENKIQATSQNLKITSAIYNEAGNRVIASTLNEGDPQKLADSDHILVMDPNTLQVMKGLKIVIPADRNASIEQVYYLSGYYKGNLIMYGVVYNIELQPEDQLREILVIWIGEDLNERSDLAQLEKAMPNPKIRFSIPSLDDNGDPPTIEALAQADQYPPTFKTQFLSSQEKPDEIIGLNANSASEFAQAFQINAREIQEMYDYGEVQGYRNYKAFRPKNKTFEDGRTAFLGLQLLRFKVPDFPDKFEYDVEENQQYDYPPTVLNYGTDGKIRPGLLLFKNWKEKHVLKPPMPFTNESLGRVAQKLKVALPQQMSGNLFQQQQQIMPQAKPKEATQKPDQPKFTLPVFKQEGAAAAQQEEEKKGALQNENPQIQQEQETQLSQMLYKIEEKFAKDSNALFVQRLQDTLDFIPTVEQLLIEMLESRDFSNSQKLRLLNRIIGQNPNINVTNKVTQFLDVEQQKQRNNQQIIPDFSTEIKKQLKYLHLQAQTTAQAAQTVTSLKTEFSRIYYNDRAKESLARVKINMPGFIQECSNEVVKVEQKPVLIEAQQRIMKAKEEAEKIEQETRIRMEIFEKNANAFKALLTPSEKQIVKLAEEGKEIVQDPQPKKLVCQLKSRPNVQGLSQTQIQELTKKFFKQTVQNMKNDVNHSVAEIEQHFRVPSGKIETQIANQISEKTNEEEDSYNEQTNSMKPQTIASKMAHKVINIRKARLELAKRSNICTQQHFQEQLQKAIDQSQDTLKTKLENEPRYLMVKVPEIISSQSANAASMKSKSKASESNNSGSTFGKTVPNISAQSMMSSQNQSVTPSQQSIHNLPIINQRIPKRVDQSLFEPAPLPQISDQSVLSFLQKNAAASEEEQAERNTQLDSIIFKEDPANALKKAGTVIQGSQVKESPAFASMNLGSNSGGLGEIKKSSTGLKNMSAASFGSLGAAIKDGFGGQGALLNLSKEAGKTGMDSQSIKGKIMPFTADQESEVPQNNTFMVGQNKDSSAKKHTLGISYKEETKKEEKPQVPLFGQKQESASQGGAIPTNLFGGKGTLVGSDKKPEETSKPPSAGGLFGQSKTTVEKDLGGMFGSLNVKENEQQQPKPLMLSGGMFGNKVNSEDKKIEGNSIPTQIALSQKVKEKKVEESVSSGAKKVDDKAQPEKPQSSQDKPQQQPSLPSTQAPLAIESKPEIKPALTQAPLTTQAPNSLQASKPIQPQTQTAPLFGAATSLQPKPLISSAFGNLGGSQGFGGNQMFSNATLDNKTFGQVDVAKVAQQAQQPKATTGVFGSGVFGGSASASGVGTFAALGASVTNTTIQPFGGGPGGFALPGAQPQAQPFGSQQTQASPFGMNQPGGMLQPQSQHPSPFFGGGAPSTQGFGAPSTQGFGAQPSGMFGGTFGGGLGGSEQQEFGTGLTQGGNVPFPVTAAQPSVSSTLDSAKFQGLKARK